MPKKIMVVDDSEADRFQYKTYLRKEYDLYEVETIKDALTQYPSIHPDCIILDYYLPDGTGCDFLKKLSAKQQGTCPVIMLTGLGDENTAITSMKSGANDYLNKRDVTQHRLMDTIDKSIKNHELKQEKKAKESETQYLALHDPLTGLLNRTEFKEIIEREIASAKRHERTFAIFYIDLDKFKNINDTLGHEVGDKVLISVAERLRRVLRKEDIISRLGGDEFAILFRELSDEERLSDIASKIIDALRTPIKINNVELSVGTSIGIATFPDSAQYYDNILKCADFAMYHAKELGRANYQFFSSRLNAIHQSRLILENALFDALKKSMFHIEYQPQFDIQTGQIVAIEALARLRHPEVGSISPSHFIPIAEEVGLIRTIGEWVLIHACYEVVEIFKNNPSLKLCVNISSKQLYNDQFFTAVRELINCEVIKPQSLVLEINESTFMTIEDDIIYKLDALRDKGIQISIDDFGTGYSSLSSLTKLPIDNLKIDKSFIKNLGKLPDAEKIINSIIGLANNFNLNVIAEGVETQTQLEYLKDHHCKYAQGFHLGEPEELSTILKAITSAQSK